MRVKIESRYSIQEKIDNANSLTGKYCVSILSPHISDIRNIRRHFRKVLRLRFHDITAPDEPVDAGKPVLFSDRHLKRLVRFYNSIRDERDAVITVHCHAGVHRSTAVGLILLYLDTRDYMTAEEGILQARAIPLPNRRVISVFDRVYGTDLMRVADSLEKRFRAYVRDEIAINQDDYLDELEVME